MKSIVGIFERRSDAERAAARLAAIGVPRDDLSLLAPGENGVAQAAAVKTTDTEQKGMGAAIGSVVGGATGASLGAAMVAVPGIGLVAAAGWAAMAVLGVFGAVGGGIAGNAIEDALSSGIPKDELFLYEDALRKGHSVVIALVATDELVDRARVVMRAEGAEDLDSARERWWIGVRPEDEMYSEPEYRRGVEAALHPDVRGKSWEDAEPYLAARYGDACRAEPFRRGYTHGRASHGEWLEKRPG